MSNAYYWNNATEEKLDKTPKKKREQELALTLDPHSPRPASTREEIHINFSTFLFDLQNRRHR